MAAPKRTRSYAKLLNSIWSSDFARLSVNAQRLYMLLISQPETNAAGVVPLMERRWARLAGDTDMTAITAGLDELEAASYVFRDEDTEELFIRSFIANDEGHKTPNILTSIRTHIAQIISPRIRKIAAETLALVLAGSPDDDWFQGLSEPMDEGSEEGFTEGMGHSTTSTSPTTRAPAAPDESPSNVVPIVPQEPAEAGTRRPDPLFEALIAACELEYDEMTDRDRRATAVAVAELRKRNVQPSECHVRAAVFARKFAHLTLTPNALAKNWAGCKPPKTRQANPSDPESRMSAGAVARW